MLSSECGSSLGESLKGGWGFVVLDLAIAELLGLSRLAVSCRSHGAQILLWVKPGRNCC